MRRRQHILRRRESTYSAHKEEIWLIRGKEKKEKDKRTEKKDETRDVE